MGDFRAPAGLLLGLDICLESLAHAHAPGESTCLQPVTVANHLSSYLSSHLCCLCHSALKLNLPSRSNLQEQLFRSAVLGALQDDFRKSPFREGRPHGG